MVNTERVDRIGAALREAGLDGLVVSLPTSVLLLSGYWPATGMALAVAGRDGRVVALAPEDEKELTDAAWAEVQTFTPASLDQLIPPIESLREPLGTALSTLGLSGGRIGFSAGPISEPAGHTAMFVFGDSLHALLSDLLPNATLVPSEETLVRLRAVHTLFELDRVRAACRLVEECCRTGAANLGPNQLETEAASAFRPPLLCSGRDGIHRAGGFVNLMSGPRSAQATGAFLISRATPIPAGSLALVQVNSYLDGAFTDVTRTYHIGDLDDKRRSWLEAVLAAREAALSVVGPGARASDVDKATRDVIAGRGFGDLFKTPTGHGVGFAVNDKDALPRLHPKSPDILEAGMVFNVEPGVYKEGEGGFRHCDMIAVTHDGAEVLTPFQCSLEELVIHHEPGTA